MTPSELRETIASILNMQVNRSMILTGLHLTPDQLQLVQANLEPDDPQVGAIGRYQNVPVFLLDTGQPSIHWLETSRTESHRGIFFSYVQLNVVN